MTGQEMIARFHGSNQETPLPGITNLDLLQAVLDEVFNDETVERLVVPAPAVTTVAGTLTYSFDAENDDDLTEILPGATNIRRVRGLWKPDQANASAVSDYNYRRTGRFNQLLIGQRLYDGTARIDNEQRLVVFEVDPGATTDTWSIDYYRKAPTITAIRRIPVLHGWEMPLVLPGMKAVFEEWQTGNSPYWRPRFENMKSQYFSALQVEQDIPRIDGEDHVHEDPHVEPM